MKTLDYAALLNKTNKAQKAQWAETHKQDPPVSDIMPHMEDDPQPTDAPLQPDPAPVAEAVSEDGDDSVDTGSGEADVKPEEEIPQVQAHEDVPSDDGLKAETGPSTDDADKVVSVKPSVPETANSVIDGHTENDSDLESFKNDINDVSSEAVPVTAADIMPVSRQADTSDNSGAANDDDDNNDDTVANDETDDREQEPAYQRPAVYNKPHKSDVPKAKRVKSSDGNSEKVGTSHLRAVPSVLVQRVRAMFPAAANNDDAIAAYIYIKEGSPDSMPLPDSVFDAAESYTGDTVTNSDLQDSILSEMLKLKKSNSIMMQKLQAVEMALAWNIFDRTGFNRDSYKDKAIKDMKFDVQGVSDMINQLESQSDLRTTREAYKKNRPLR